MIDGWEGYVAVDGVNYEFLGQGLASFGNITNLTAATGESVDALHGNYTC